MASEPILKETLRRLMRPRTVLRSNFCVFHDGGAQVSNFTLELAQSDDGCLSVIEYCADGEMIASRKMTVADTSPVLDERLIARAMQAIWQDVSDTVCRDVVSVRSTTMLTTASVGMQGHIVQGWHYRRGEAGGTMELWTDKHMPVAASTAVPDAQYLYLTVMHLQQEAARLHDNIDASSAQSGNAVVGSMAVSAG
jgi:hypothetical protein